MVFRCRPVLFVRKHFKPKKSRRKKRTPMMLMMGGAPMLDLIVGAGEIFSFCFCLRTRQQTNMISKRQRNGKESRSPHGDGGDCPSLLLRVADARSERGKLHCGARGARFGLRARLTLGIRGVEAQQNKNQEVGGVRGCGGSHDPPCRSGEGGPPMLHSSHLFVSNVLPPTYSASSRKREKSFGSSGITMP